MLHNISSIIRLQYAPCTDLALYKYENKGATILGGICSVQTNDLTEAIEIRWNPVGPIEDLINSQQFMVDMDHLIDDNWEKLNIDSIRKFIAMYGFPIGFFSQTHSCSLANLHEHFKNLYEFRKILTNSDDNLIMRIVSSLQQNYNNCKIIGDTGTLFRHSDTDPTAAVFPLYIPYDDEFIDAICDGDFADAQIRIKDAVLSGAFHYANQHSQSVIEYTGVINIKTSIFSPSAYYLLKLASETDPLTSKQKVKKAKSKPLARALNTLNKRKQRGSISKEEYTHLKIKAQELAKDSLSHTEILEKLGAC